MKRSFLLSLVFAFACCLFANQSAQAQYVEGVSILAEEPLYDLVISYSATESDYYTTFYYDAYVTAGLHVNGIQVAYNTDQDSGGDGVAEVSFGVPISYDAPYFLVSDHYVVEYYEVYEPTWGYVYWDPYGYDFLPGGNYTGGYTFLPAQETFTYSHLIYLGSTWNALLLRRQINYLGFKDDHKIYKFDNTITNSNPTGGTAIDPNDNDPVWDRTPARSLPAAYTKDTHPKMFIILTLDPPLSSPTPVTVRAKLNGTNGTVVATKAATVSGSGVQINDIEVTGNLETNTNTVKIGQYTFYWEMRINNGTWRSIGSSGPHTIYWTWGTPKANPFVIDVLNDPGPGGFIQDVYPRIYDRALEIACGNANGASTIEDIVKANNKGVFDNAPYDYKRTPSGIHPLNKYVNSADNGSNCMSHASLLTGLLRSIGIEAATNYLWGGTVQERHYYNWVGSPNFPITVKLQVAALIGKPFRI